MRRILIATDGAPWSREAIHQFLETACIGEAELHVLSVIRPGSDQAFQDAVAAAQQAIDQATLDLAFGGRAVKAFTHVGEPADVIVRTAAELGASLVVLGTRSLDDGRSVAEDVLHRVACGVLIYPQRAAVLA
jgi:nucleotide-binding universal stress UspA family protein